MLVDLIFSSNKYNTSKIMEYTIHRIVEHFIGDNKVSWAKGIITYSRWLKIFPHLYGLIPKPKSKWKHVAWCEKNLNVMGSMA